MIRGLLRVLNKFWRWSHLPKLPRYRSLYFLPAKIAQIDSYIRRYLNVSKIKINGEKIGPLNFWVLSTPQFSSILISRFLALFIILSRERNDLISRPLPIFTRSRPKSSQLVTRVFIFLNLRPERNERICRFFPTFPNLRAKKWTHCSIFPFCHEN